MVFQGSNGSWGQGTAGSSQKLTSAAPASHHFGISCCRHRSSSFRTAPCADAYIIIARSTAACERQVGPPAEVPSPSSVRFPSVLKLAQLFCCGEPDWSQCLPRNPQNLLCNLLYPFHIALVNRLGARFRITSVRARSAHLSRSLRARPWSSPRAYPRSSPSSLCCSSHSLPSLDYYIEVVSNLLLL